MTTPYPRFASPTTRAALVTCLALAAVFIASPTLAGPPQAVTLVGTVESLPATPNLVGDWTVNHLTVHVAATTTIDQSKAAAVVNALVQIRGTRRADMSIDAATITVLGTPPAPRPRLHPAELTGVVEVLPATPDLVGDWKVGEVAVHVAATARIDQSKAPAALGALVRVRGSLRDDRSIDATDVVVLRAAQKPRDCSLAVLHLEATAAAPAGAEGVVLARRMVFADGSEREDLKVSVEKLLPATTYDVVIDTINAGLIVTDENGEGHLFLSSLDIPGAEPLPAELRPVTGLAHVEVLAGTVAALAGDFADAESRQCGERPDRYLALALLQDADGAPKGVVIGQIRGDLQTLRLSAWGLTPGGTVALLVDGIALGNLTVRDDGTVAALYSTSPGPGALPLPPEVLPVGDLLHAELHAGDGSTIAGGDFALPPGE